VKREVKRNYSETTTTLIKIRSPETGPEEEGEAWCGKKAFRARVPGLTDGTRGIVRKEKEGGVEIYLPLFRTGLGWAQSVLRLRGVR